MSLLQSALVGYALGPFVKPLIWITLKAASAAYEAGAAAAYEAVAGAAAEAATPEFGGDYILPCDIVLYEECLGNPITYD